LPLNHTSKYAELTSRQFELIGRLVVEWSNIEFLLGSLLSRLLFTPEFLGRVYTDELTAHRLEAAVRKAMSIHQKRYGNAIVPAGVTQEVGDVIKEIEVIRGKRNKFSHNCWCRQTDKKISGFRLSGNVPQDKHLEKDSLIITIGEMEELYRTSYSVVDRLSGIVARLPEMSEKEALKSCRSRGH